VEILGFGTRLIIDAIQADQASLADVRVSRAFINQACTMLEPTTHPKVMLLEHPQKAGGGFSVGVLLAESQITLHTFPDLRKLTASTFSRKSFHPPEVLRALERHFGSGRVESETLTYSRLLPREIAALERALRGERMYARLRLDEGLTNGG